MKMNPEQLRNYRLRVGARKLKNRSSKHLFMLTKQKSVFRLMSGEQLERLSASGVFAADVELSRRERTRPAREARKQRYVEKLEAKRGVKKQI